MSDRLPSLKADEVIRALRRAGFEVTRIKGATTSCDTEMMPAEARLCLFTQAGISSAVCCARLSAMLA